MTPIESTIEELEKPLESFDWRRPFYGPLYDHIEASTEDEKSELKQMEQLIPGCKYFICKATRKCRQSGYWFANTGTECLWEYR